MAATQPARHGPNSTVWNGISPGTTIPSTPDSNVGPPVTARPAAAAVGPVSPLPVQTIPSNPGHQATPASPVAVGGRSSAPPDLGSVPVSTPSPTTVPAGSGPSSGWNQQHLPSGTASLDAVSCVNGQDCWAGGYSGVVATTDGGRTWVQQTLPAPASGEYVTGISCVDASTCWASTTAGRVYHTADGGSSWTPEKVSGGTVYGISCFDQQHCWAVDGANGVETTTDGGSNWSAVSPCSSCTIHGITCATDADCLVVGVSQANGTVQPAVWGSADGGSSWKLQADFAGDPGSTGAALTGVSCSSVQDCTAVGADWIASTTDSGATWTPQAVPSSGEVAVSCTTAGSCWAIGGGTVLYRSSPTAAWTVHDQYDGSSMQIVALSCASTGGCWAAGSGGDGSASAPGVILARTSA